MSQISSSPRTAKLDLLRPADQFAHRHLGPRQGDIQHMLEVLDVNTLDELIDQTIPANIRFHRDLNLPPAHSESESLAELRRLADQNQLFRSFIGMGYSNCLTPPVILRNVMENPLWYTDYTPYQPKSLRDGSKHCSISRR